MKKNKIIMLILTMLLLIIFPLTINAAQIDPEHYYSAGPKKEQFKGMYKFGGSVAGIIQIVGTIVSAGTLIIIGIRYVVASAEEKAEYKERMLPYVIGAVLLFGATNIVNVAYKAFNKPKINVYYIKNGDLQQLDDETLKTWYEDARDLAIGDDDEDINVKDLVRLKKELQRRGLQ